MRRKLIAGNWKMNQTASQARALIAALRADLDRDCDSISKSRDVVVMPPSIDIPAVSEELQGSFIQLGAQNMHWEDSGAFTGEISAPMLLQFGVKYVIVGHSERRHIFLESDAFVNKKLHAALRHGLTPIMCIGETREHHDAGRTLHIVLSQTQSGLEGVDRESAEKITIAYEPVWAIGTGRVATPEHAQMVHGAVREVLSEKWGMDTARQIRILYGGSVTPDNVDSLLSKHDIDGALVGGASLKADSFARIARANLQ